RCGNGAVSRRICAARKVVACPCFPCSRTGRGTSPFAPRSPRPGRECATVPARGGSNHRGFAPCGFVPRWLPPPGHDGCTAVAPAFLAGYAREGGSAVARFVAEAI